MVQNKNNDLSKLGFVPQWAQGIILQAAQKHNVPAAILASLLQQESGFNIHAQSPAGAMGIAQFMPGTAKSYGINPLNPAQAIDAAAAYLRNSLDTFGGDMGKALASYNAGLGAVERYGGIPPYQETQNYVKNIMQMAGENERNLIGGRVAEQANQQFDPMQMITNYLQSIIGQQRPQQQTQQQLPQIPQAQPMQTQGGMQPVTQTPTAISLDPAMQGKQQGI